MQGRHKSRESIDVESVLFRMSFRAAAHADTSMKLENDCGATAKTSSPSSLRTLDPPPKSRKLRARPGKDDAKLAARERPMRLLR
jgi:hypothetical protein